MQLIVPTVSLATSSIMGAACWIVPYKPTEIPSVDSVCHAQLAAQTAHPQVVINVKLATPSAINKLAPTQQHVIQLVRVATVQHLKPVSVAQQEDIYIMQHAWLHAPLDSTHHQVSVMPVSHPVFNVPVPHNVSPVKPVIFLWVVPVQSPAHLNSNYLAVHVYRIQLAPYLVERYACNVPLVTIWVLGNVWLIVLWVRMLMLDLPPVNHASQAASNAHQPVAKCVSVHSSTMMDSVWQHVHRAPTSYQPQQPPMAQPAKNVPLAVYSVPVILSVFNVNKDSSWQTVYVLPNAQVEPTYSMVSVSIVRQHVQPASVLQSVSPAPQTSTLIQLLNSVLQHAQSVPLPLRLEPAHNVPLSVKVVSQLDAVSAKVVTHCSVVNVYLPAHQVCTLK